MTEDDVRRIVREELAQHELKITVKNNGGINPAAFAATILKIANDQSKRLS